MYWYLPPIQYDLLAIYDQSNGLATALHGQCGLDKIIALAGTMYFCGILGLWLWLYILLWRSLKPTCKVVTIACFRVNFGFHFQVPIFTNSVFPLNFISLLPTHCVCFSCHQVLSHQDPIWRRTRVKTRKDARPPICRSCSFSPALQSD